MDACIQNCRMAVEVLASQIAERKATGLRPKTSFLSRPKARKAMVLTALASPVQIEGAPMKQEKRITKADRRLRAFTEAAEAGKCHTLNEIAEVMGITRERVRQIEQRAKRSFRNRLTRLLKSEGVTSEDVADIFASAKLE